MNKTSKLFSKKQIFVLIVPLIVEQFLALTIGLADSMMVSDLGEEAVSGVSLVDTINYLFHGIFSALCTGGAIVFSQYIGHKDDDSASLAAKQLITISISVSALIGLIFIIFNSPLLNTVYSHAEAGVISQAEAYFFWTALSYPSIALYNAGAALFRAKGDSKTSMIVSLIMNVINLLFNALFIYGLKMGVVGAALGTLISRIFAAALILYLFARQKGTVSIRGTNGYLPDLKMMKTILRIGVPSGIESSVFQVGKILIQSVATYIGTIATAAHQIANSIGSLTLIPATAIGLAMITVVGQCSGANEKEQAKRYSLQLLLFSTLATLICAIILFLCLDLILPLYKVSGETIDLTREILMIYFFFSPPLWTAAFVTPHALRAAGDVKFTLTVSLFSMWIFRVGFSHLFVYTFSMGIHGIWFAMYADWVARALFFIPRILGKKWQESNVI